MKVLYIGSNFTEIYFLGSIFDNESALDQVMARWQAGDKPLPEPMLTHFHDVILHHMELTNHEIASGVQWVNHLHVWYSVPTDALSPCIVLEICFFLYKHIFSLVCNLRISVSFCEARRASHCHSPQTTYSSKSTCCAISAQNSAMHVVVYAGRLTSQRSIVEIINW